MTMSAYNLVRGCALHSWDPVTPSELHLPRRWTVNKRDESVPLLCWNLQRIPDVEGTIKTVEATITFSPGYRAAIKDQQMH